MNWAGQMLARIYLRASSVDQDAQRARAALEAFAAERGLLVAGVYSENESGASLQRPELFRLLDDAAPGQILLCEQIDRLTRLTEADWRSLRTQLAAKSIRIVALDLPTSHAIAVAGDEFTARMLAAVNEMLLDVLAAVARKDYTDRRRRQQQGIAKARLAGAYRGRPVDTQRHELIATMLGKGLSWSQVQAATGCSRATIAKISKASKS